MLMLSRETCLPSSLCPSAATSAAAGLGSSFSGTRVSPGRGSQNALHGSSPPLSSLFFCLPLGLPETSTGVLALRVPRGRPDWAAAHPYVRTTDGDVQTHGAADCWKTWTAEDCLDRRFSQERLVPWELGKFLSTAVVGTTRGKAVYCGDSGHGLWS